LQCGKEAKRHRRSARYCSDECRRRAQLERDALRKEKSLPAQRVRGAERRQLALGRGICRYGSYGEYVRHLAVNKRKRDMTKVDRPLQKVLSPVAGADLKLISSSLGHSTLAVTANTYLHLAQSFQERHAAQLDSLVGGAVAEALAAGPGRQAHRENENSLCYKAGKFSPSGIRTRNQRSRPVPGNREKGYVVRFRASLSRLSPPDSTRFQPLRDQFVTNSSILLGGG
jgi:hypothetical protein